MEMWFLSNPKHRIYYYNLFRAAGNQAVLTSMLVPGAALLWRVMDVCQSLGRSGTPRYARGSKSSRLGAMFVGSLRDDLQLAALVALIALARTYR